MIELVVTLLVVGFVVWAANKLAGPYVSAEILRIANIVVLICVIVFVAQQFGVCSSVRDIPVPQVP